MFMKHMSTESSSAPKIQKPEPGSLLRYRALYEAMKSIEPDVSVTGTELM